MKEEGKYDLGQQCKARSYVSEDSGWSESTLFALDNKNFLPNQTTTARRADSEDQEEDEGKAQDAQELLEAINEGKENNNGRVEDQYVIRFFRDKLLSMPCQNQGFIIDGFPKTIEQAKELFVCKCKYAIKIQNNNKRTLEKNCCNYSCNLLGTNRASSREILSSGFVTR